MTAPCASPLCVHVIVTCFNEDAFFAAVITAAPSGVSAGVSIVPPEPEAAVGSSADTFTFGPIIIPKIPATKKGTPTDCIHFFKNVPSLTSALLTLRTYNLCYPDC